MPFPYNPPQDVIKILLNHQREMKKMRGAAQFGLSSILNKIIKEWNDCREGRKIPAPSRFAPKIAEDQT